jgi:hypothetical protein
MKQISARQFRTSFADLTEAVTVLRRDAEGNFQVLGTWTPIPQSAADLGAALSRVYPEFRPAPKPKR